jgi:hypothetical protein
VEKASEISAACSQAAKPGEAATLREGLKTSILSNYFILIYFKESTFSNEQKYSKITAAQWGSVFHVQLAVTCSSRRYSKFPTQAAVLKRGSLLRWTPKAEGHFYQFNDAPELAQPIKLIC